MGTKICFASGREVILPDAEDGRFMKRAMNAGFRYYKCIDGMIIPFNHNTIEFIEPIEPTSVPEPEAPKKVEVVPEPTPEEVQMKEEKEQGEADRETKKERLAKMEEEFMARANCKHKNGDGTTKYVIRYVGTVNGRKYFPVCSFCGHRGRYVGVPKIEEGRDPNWTMEDIKNATPYEE